MSATTTPITSIRSLTARVLYTEPARRNRITGTRALVSRRLRSPRSGSTSLILKQAGYRPNIKCGSTDPKLQEIHQKARDIEMNLLILGGHVKAVSSSLYRWEQRNGRR